MVTNQEARIWRALDEVGWWHTTSSVATVARVSRSTAYRHLRRMQERGIIEHKPEVYPGFYRRAQKTFTAAQMEYITTLEGALFNEGRNGRRR